MDDIAVETASSSPEELATLTRADADKFGRATIRGEPAIGREQSREPRLYSVEPT